MDPAAPQHSPINRYSNHWKPASMAYLQCRIYLNKCGSVLSFPANQCYHTSTIISTLNPYRIVRSNVCLMEWFPNACTCWFRWNSGGGKGGGNAFLLVCCFTTFSLLFLNGWLTVYIKIFMDLLLMASQVEQFRESLGDVWIFYCTSSLTFPFKPPHQSLAIQGLAYISIRKMTWWGLANKNIMWYLTSITGGRGHDKALLLRVSCATWIGWCVLVGINAWLVCWIVGLISTSPELGIGTWQKLHHFVEPFHNRYTATCLACAVLSNVLVSWYPSIPCCCSPIVELLSWGWLMYVILLVPLFIHDGPIHWSWDEEVVLMRTRDYLSGLYTLMTACLFTSYTSKQATHTTPTIT